MARRYDSRTTTFSPEGRLYQVEYALKAISFAGTVVGVLAKDGVVLVAEKQTVNKLLEHDTACEKLYVVDDSMICAVAGMTSDANVLIEYVSQSVQRYLRTYNTQIPCEQLVKQVCDVKQGYTQHGGLRPFGVSLMYAGWDKHKQFQLFYSDPSGNYSGWMAKCMGSNDTSAQNLLNQDYKEGCSIAEATELAVKVLSKKMDSAMLTSDKIEISVLYMPEGATKPEHRVLTLAEVDEQIKKYGLAKSDEDKAAEAAEPQQS